jgi:hypothetical protein
MPAGNQSLAPMDDEAFDEMVKMMQRGMQEATKENFLEYVANRLEVIDHTTTNPEYPRRLVKWDDKPFKVSLSFQDDGRTLKVFLLDISQEPR